MNFSEALHAHVRWTLEFKDAIANRKALDIAQICAADRCDFGQWLHGEAQANYGNLEAYADCVAKHARLHRVAAKLAQQVNAGDYAEAAIMLHDGSAYAEASIELGKAVERLGLGVAK
jgi:methyl-accepting chemotaxis protein